MHWKYKKRDDNNKKWIIANNLNIRLSITEILSQAKEGKFMPWYFFLSMYLSTLFQQTMQHQVCHVDSKAEDIEKSDARNYKTKLSYTFSSTEGQQGSFHINHKTKLSIDAIIY